jgi:hypothetical protein
MHDNFFKEREFALDIIETKEEIKIEETNSKIKNDFSHKINVKTKKLNNLKNKRLKNLLFIFFISFIYFILYIAYA